MPPVLPENATLPLEIFLEKLQEMYRYSCNRDLRWNLILQDGEREKLL